MASFKGLLCHNQELHTSVESPLSPHPEEENNTNTVVQCVLYSLISDLEWGVVDVGGVFVLVVSGVTVVDTPTVITHTSDAHTVGITENSSHLS